MVYSTVASSVTAVKYSWAAAANCSVRAAVAEIFRSAAMLVDRVVAAVLVETESAGPLEMAKKVHSSDLTLVANVCKLAAARHQERHGNTTRLVAQDATSWVSAAQVHALLLGPEQPVGNLTAVDKVGLDLRYSKVNYLDSKEPGRNLERQVHGAGWDHFDGPTGLEMPAQPRKSPPVLYHVGCTKIVAAADG